MAASRKDSREIADMARSLRFVYFRRCHIANDPRAVYGKRRDRETRVMEYFQLCHVEIVDRGTIKGLDFCVSWGQSC